MTVPTARRPLPQFLPWVRFPSAWIADGGLLNLRWSPGVGAGNIAALMALAVIAHHSDKDTGQAYLTWDELCDRASLSRGKLGQGLDVLSKMNLIDRAPEGRSTFRLSNFNSGQAWAMLPAKGLYSHGSVSAFRDFSLRQRAELDALKIYFLLAARRDRNTNFALINYEKIELNSGVGHNHIRRALSLLAGHGLIHISSHPSEINPYGIANVYRLVHLEPRRHPGTTGRAMELPQS